MSFFIRGALHEKVILDLQRNDDLFLHPVVVRHVGADGSTQSVATIPAGSHLAFRGTARLEQDGGRQAETVSPSGWARMSFSVRDGEQLGEGAFSINGIEYHVVQDSTYRRTRSPGEPDVSIEAGSGPRLVAWTESSQLPYLGLELKKRQQNNVTCPISELDFNKVHLGLATGNKDMARRQSGGLSGLDLGSLVRSPPDCPTSRKIALLGIATDCSYTAQFESSDQLREHVLSVVNTASGLYERSFNMSLRVQNLTISDRNCPSSGASSSTPWNLDCGGQVDISGRLQRLTSWKRSTGPDGNAVWSLFSACPSGSTVGIAWIGTACNGGDSQSRGAPGANVVVRTRSEWQVLAHELGHNFGAVHDCTAECRSASSERCCPLSGSACDANGRYIMNPAASTSMTEFSPCTIATICTAMQRNLIRTSCLSDNENVRTISSGVCGNGVVEPGEECDCGGEAGCGASSRCCNPATCQLVNGAACDPSNDGCCTSQCQVSSSGSVCRASTGPCDPEESCNGSSASCPTDVRLPDGQSCGDGNNGTTCASGQCTSRSMQCSLVLFNSTGRSASASACDFNSCQMNCSPTGSGSNSDSQSCRVTGADFLDGTPCGGAGTASLCYGGTCRAAESGGGGGGASEWINRNRSAFIAIVVIGGVAVVLAAWCGVACVRRRRTRSRRAEESQARMAALRAGAPHMEPANQSVQVPPAAVFPGPPPRPMSRLSRAPTLTHRYIVTCFILHSKGRPCPPSPRADTRSVAVLYGNLTRLHACPLSPATDSLNVIISDNQRVSRDRNDDVAARAAGTAPDQLSASALSTPRPAPSHVDMANSDLMAILSARTYPIPTAPNTLTNFPACDSPRPSSFDLDIDRETGASLCGADAGGLGNLMSRHNPQPTFVPRHQSAATSFFKTTASERQPSVGPEGSREAIEDMSTTVVTLSDSLLQSGVLAPHANLSCTRETLEKCLRLAKTTNSDD
ncbi:ADAM 8 precursor [Metarhizium album ARSEF 1941]|uniref:Disintegrin and metalloproteinase domain-containing protein B n=1 Tax=Metarhizium album (strain ARSEF 1941) TaxID=1081103 RepID=A0A0B2WKU5_METAS|nr:ADAM 8 precursor [Metarhizium album ARSEF 1941]KHN94112.1 ADAM 8 precursor [Metarhizium album ARSEF 1941]